MASSKLYLWIAMLMLSLYTTSSAADLSGVGCSPKLDGYPGCKELELNATIHFSFNRDIPSLSVLFVASPPTPKGWTAWGINLNGSGMIGAEVLAAFRSNNIITVNTYRLKAHNYVIAAKLSLELWDVRAEEIGDIFKIYATIRIPNNMKSLNHTWNTGPSVTEKGELEIHSTEDPNLKSKGELILSEGIACAVRDRAIQRYKISIIFGWSSLHFIVFLVGKVVNLYPTSSTTWWLCYLHTGFHLLAYGVAAAGWGIGVILGFESFLLNFHQNLGTTILLLATLMLLSELYIQPDKDQPYRTYWVISHYLFGYSVWVCGIIHAFRAFELFHVQMSLISWYRTLISLLCLIVFVVEGLEVKTWWKKKT